MGELEILVLIAAGIFAGKVIVDLIDIFYYFPEESEDDDEWRPKRR